MKEEEIINNGSDLLHTPYQNIYLLILAISLLLATVSAIIAIISYRKSQQWKKMEYVASLVTSLKKNKNFERATLMLDWTNINIKLYDGEVPDLDNFQYNNRMLIEALDDAEKMHGNINRHQNPFSPVEFIIRRVFDDFFENLDTINIHIQKGLYKLEDIDSYLVYWISLIAHDSWDDPRIKIAIDNFICTYNYTGVFNLCNEMMQKGMLFKLNKEA